MKNFNKILLLLALCVAFIAPSFSIEANAAPIVTTPSGYTDASDVEYITQNNNGINIIVNWGARGENAQFLSTYAQSFYTDGYDYQTLPAQRAGLPLHPRHSRRGGRGDGRDRRDLPLREAL